MSALCGFLNLDAAPADPQIVAAQVARLKHCGPDGSGTFTDGPFALGHLLLSITPESANETSPWRSADGQRVIAFDGRLDHRDDLCRALAVPPEDRGVPDPELVLRSYEKWGDDCATRLEGEFAFALWDGRRRELYCAVDIFSQRKFYYHVGTARFSFASAIRGVLAVPGVPRALDEFSLACRLGEVPRPRDGSLYKEICRLRGARTLRIRPRGEPQIHQYWQLQMVPEIRVGRPEEQAEALREMLERATRSALRSRHPVAATLSGGLDSTGVACLALRELKARGQGLTTVSNVLPDGYQDECPRAEGRFIRSALDCYPEMEARFAEGAVFPVLTLDDAYYDQQDEPDGDTKSYRTRELFHLAKLNGARVLLGGFGGDMAASFPGTGYLELLARSGHWLKLMSQIRLQATARGMSFAGILQREVLHPLSPRWIRYWNNRLRHPQPAPEASLAIHPDFARRFNLAELRASTGHAHPMPEDFRTALVPAVNSGNVGGSQAHPFFPEMESPQPLRDRRIWEWCYRLPLSEFVLDGMPRGLYRRALREVLPSAVLRRNCKGWFAPDYQQRLAACRPVIDEFLLRYPATDPVWGYVDRAKVEATLQRLDQPVTNAYWDNRYQGILCRGLRAAHFCTWLSRTADNLG